MKKQQLIFFFLLLLLILSKFLTLVQFSTSYTSNDDLIIWQGARDYSQGIFHEPYYYGQNYNFMLESLVAVPFIWIGMPFNWAVPLSTTILATFPFVMFATVLFRRKFHLSAYVFLSLPVLLSIEYDVLTSVSRGFVSGIFFLSFLIYPILEPTRRKFMVIFGLAASFGYIVNPNTLIFTVPAGIYLLFLNYKNYRFYLYVLLSVLPAFAFAYWAKSFYIQNPEFLLHSMWELFFKWIWIGEAFNYLDLFFTGLTPIFWQGNWMILPILLILGILLFRKSKPQSIAILLSVVFIILTFGINKIHDGKDWIFYSSTRMYLAVPLLLGLAMHWHFSHSRKIFKWPAYLLVGIASLTFLAKLWLFPAHLKELEPEREINILSVSTLDALEKDCGVITKHLDNHEVDLVIFIPNWKHSDGQMQILNYGCSFIDERMHSSVLSVYERRTWQYEAALHQSYRNVLLYGYELAHQPVVTENESITVLQRDPDIILIENNNLSIPELTAQFHIEIKRQ